MKKNYFSTLFAALMLFLAMPATAQVSGMGDLFGKYKFTATIETTEAGKAHESLWKNDCEVIITKGTNGAPGAIKGLLGASQDQTVASINVNENKFFVVNPNPNYGLLSSSNPYIGVADMTLEDLQQYTMEFHYNPETKEITIPDFAICSFTWPGGVMTGEVLANVSNVKMTLLETEEVVIPEIEGEWTFKPYSMGYVRNDSTFVYEYKMTLAAKDDTKKLYNATFKIGDFDEFTLEATFNNGVNLIIPFNNQYLDAEKKIRLGVKATTQEMTLIKEGQLSFDYSSSTMMWQNDYFVVRKDTIVKKEVDGTVVEKDSAMTLQQVSYGWIEREDPNAYDWSGTYTVNVAEVEDLLLDDGIDFPSTFEMEIAKAAGSYTVKRFAGYEGEYYPAIGLTPSEDGKSATLDLKGYYGFTILQSFGEVSVGEGTDYAYHALTDVNGESTSLKLLLNEDGTISIEDFSVSYFLWNANEYTPLALLSGVSATKAEAPKFAWIGDYTLTTGQLDKYYQGDDVEFPETFDVNIAYFDGSQYGMDSYYYISTFMNKNIGSTPIKLTIAEDGWSADMTTGGMCGAIVGGETYYKIYDMNASANPIAITGNEDGTISIPSFFIKVYNYKDGSEAAGAWYKNVTLTRKPEPVITLTAEVVEGAERTFEFASTVAGTVISIDWGNGEIVVADTLTEAYDGWNQKEVKGTPVGNGEIKIYATDTLCHFNCVSNVNGPGITKLDVSKATELTELYANGNKLTSVDVSMLSKLEKLYLNNNSLTEVKDLPASLTYLQLANNKLTTFDGSKLTAVSSLYLSENNLGTLDVSNMPALKTLYALDCSLTSFTVGALTTKKATISVKNNDTISTNNNLLETLDLSEAIGLEGGYLYAENNELTEIKFPNVKVNRVNIQGNKFTLATIPSSANVTTLNYAPQQDMAIEDINGTVDLSAQNSLTGFAAEAQATTYTWLTEAGDTLVAGVDYTEEAGKFTFIKDQTQKVYCTMTTEAFPKFTGANVFKTVAVAVTAAATGIDSVEASVELTGDIYAVDGKLIKRNASVADMPKGLYIVKTAAGKAIKVIRK